jgi:hypothetical protein
MSRIIWMLGDKAMNKHVSHLPGVSTELRIVANSGAAKARGTLARHRYQGKASIEVTHGSVDYFVSLVDHSGPEDGGPAAAAIEFGRSGGRRGATRGIHAVTGAF